MEIVPYLFYTYLNETGKTEQATIEVLIENETLWLTQKAMANLFDCSTDNISLHLQNIYKDKELEEVGTTEDFSVVHRRPLIF